ncbi:MAG TPA: D-glycero-beta-D-manno-heptose 1,7-bisphosphate 7-phosphatase [Rubrivivax sp.]|jgi:D-glycero-D-manno-heptose 1,7-bisphosphate phosphatase|nr:D-glycero-beta-D-manno-heptose 1,7-bisphosphate 7-phosphatase [Rhodoferax sp.]MCL4739944.1 D-glycero-beta-D-manno-heptose 1,7-bisphosphate 7-phosphatase [Burkholderiaceae bacterium]MCP5287829.1 D-glycero-beta-D-manno-heptose 1,7-bisphosphate 7-phosphatase [Burkholderiaceae bacterium]HMQ71040.1 D-glycero-beta-D-manno-heptose 1,7-bisphosphate 7-phosphatase [Rubrivivax sp.]HMR71293.1 D-glycero-beta-D-manno-heptose 1,7-bisphosphate 7-phosphatase [Rubrivivax sp.]
MPSHHAVKLVILGRDGVLNAYREDHVKAPEEWQPIPGALEAVARLNHAGWHTVVATNQAGIGRGMIDMASINAVHAHMNRELMARGGRIDAVFFCPHAPEEQCDCRKPLPGMMLDIGRRYGVDLAHVPMVGDTLRDLQAAAAAGCEPHLVLTGRAEGLDADAVAQRVAQVPATQVHDDLPAFAEWLLRRGRAAQSMPGALGG